MSQNRPQPSEPLDSPLDDARRRKGMLFLGLATGALGFSMMLQMGLNDNFLVEVMDVDAYHKGLLEAIRESCGIFAVGILALIAGLREPKIATLTLTVFGVGLGAYAGLEKGSGSFFWLAAFSMVWSQGFHVWVPLPNSMVLAMAEPGKTGKRLGQLQKYGAVGSAMALAVCLAPSAARWLAKENVLGMAGSGLANLHLPLQPMYWVAGVAGIVGAAFCLGIPRDIKAPGMALVFRKKYWLYYLMCLLEGWRKQIFIAFAGYLLVKKFDTPIDQILLLWAVIQVISWVLARRVGRLIDLVGERKILMLYYASVAVVFCGYALIKNASVLKCLFVIDNTFFLLSMALTTYVRRIAPVEEHTATLSMGVAMNHIAAVTMPLVGGILWVKFGYEAAFYAGVVAAVGSIFVAMMIPRQQARGKGQ